MYGCFCKEQLTKNWPEIFSEHLGNEATVMRITLENPVVHSPDLSYSCDFTRLLTVEEKGEYDSTKVGIVTKDCGVMVIGCRYYDDHHPHQPYWMWPLFYSIERKHRWSICNFFRSHRLYQKLKKIFEDVIKLSDTSPEIVCPESTIGENDNKIFVEHQR